MKKSNFFLAHAFVLAAALIGSGAVAFAASNEQAKPTKVRWLLAHQPIDAFRRAALSFAEELKRETKGQLELVLLEPKDVGAKNGNVEPKRIFELLTKGEVELSQTVTTSLGELDPNFWVLDLPFLFKDHAHASRVLDGKTGARLLASLEKSKLHGLAFTYSGGFRVIPTTDKALRSVKDFEGLRVRTTKSPVAHATLRQLGATPVSLSIEEGQNALNSGTIEAAETTYIRVNSVIGDQSKYLNETEHSLFLTTILASDRFMSSLSAENRAALKRAALNAARLERNDSVADGKKVKQEFQQSGVQIVSMNKANKAEFRRKLLPVYDQFEAQFDAGLVKEIKSQSSAR